MEYRGFNTLMVHVHSKCRLIGESRNHNRGGLLRARVLSFAHLFGYGRAEGLRSLDSDIKGPATLETLVSILWNDNYRENNVHPENGAYLSSSVEKVDVDSRSHAICAIEKCDKYDILLRRFGRMYNENYFLINDRDRRWH